MNCPNCVATSKYVKLFRLVASIETTHPTVLSIVWSFVGFLRKHAFVSTSHVYSFTATVLALALFYKSPFIAIVKVLKLFISCENGSLPLNVASFWKAFSSLFDSLLWLSQVHAEMPGCDNLLRLNYPSVHIVNPKSIKSIDR